MMTTQRPDGGHKGIELLLVIMVLAVFATIIATSLGFPSIAPGETVCAQQPSSPAGALDAAQFGQPITSPDDLAARRQSLDSSIATCAG